MTPGTTWTPIRDLFARPGLPRPAHTRDSPARRRPHRRRNARHRAAARSRARARGLRRAAGTRRRHGRPRGGPPAGRTAGGKPRHPSPRARPRPRRGAFALTERARTELVAAGGRPRRLVLSRLDALTSTERRAAQLAAAGLSNREIAQNLFVTTRTVEGHLTHTYQKLAITSREQLPAALAPRTAGLPPCSGIALSASPSPSTTTALMADGAD